MLEAIIVVVLVIWLFGWAAHLGGSLIHILLVVALIVLIYRFLTGRRV